MDAGRRVAVGMAGAAVMLAVAVGVALSSGVLVAGAVLLAVGVTMVMVVDEAVAGPRVGTVAVTSAAVGGAGVALATTQPTHSSADTMVRHAPRARNMPRLYIEPTYPSCAGQSRSVPGTNQ